MMTLEALQKQRDDADRTYSQNLQKELRAYFQSHTEVTFLQFSRITITKPCVFVLVSSPFGVFEWQMRRAGHGIWSPVSVIRIEE